MTDRKYNKVEYTPQKPSNVSDLPLHSTQHEIETKQKHQNIHDVINQMPKKPFQNTENMEIQTSNRQNSLIREDIDYKQSRSQVAEKLNNLCAKFGVEENEYRVKSFEKIISWINRYTTVTKLFHPFKFIKMTQLFDKECRVIIVLLDALYEEAIVKDYWAMLVESDGDRIEAVKEFLATMNIACDDMEKQINEENEDLYEITLYLYNKFNSDKIYMDYFRGIKKAGRTERESIKDKPNAKPNYLDLENFDVETTKISETIVQNHDNIENEQNTRKAVKESEISYQESLESQLLFYKEQLSILEVRTHDLLKKLKIKSIGTSLEGSILAEHDDDLGSIEEITGKLLDYLESPNYRSFEIIQDPNAYQEELKKDSDSVSVNAELDTFVSYSHIPENHIETDVIEYRGVKSSARSTTDKKSEYLSNFGTTKSLKKDRAHKPIEKKKDSQRDKIIRISKKKKSDKKEVPKKKDNWCAGVL